MLDWLFTGLDIFTIFTDPIADKNQTHLERVSGAERSYRVLEQQILSLLQSEMSGAQIAEAIKQKFTYQGGYDPIYLALHNLEKEGLVRSRWSESTGVPKRYYELPVLPMD